VPCGLLVVADVLVTDRGNRKPGDALRSNRAGDTIGRGAFSVRRFVLAAGVGVVVAAATFWFVSRGAEAYVAYPLVSDRGLGARVADRALVNAWGLASSPTGPWWTSNEASATSTLYDGRGRKQLLTVRVDGGPTGIVFNGGRGFVVRSGGVSGPARFIYACEDGTIRAWSPSVPHGWSKEAVVAVDPGATGAVFRGVTIARGRLYATDFHNDRVVVYDDRWRPVVRRGAFVDPSIPEWYAPFGIQAVGSRIFVSYAYRAPPSGNDAPKGGYVDEFDLAGRLVGRVAKMGPLNEPWGIARGPDGRLYVANFGTGRIAIFSRRSNGWRFDDYIRGRSGKPLSVNGVWGIAFGNGGMAGPKDTLFFAAGPHRWVGETESDVHGLFGAISRHAE
jgi:uncharacterized protein (TIGR03118 family)